MPTLNASKWTRAELGAQSSHANARDGSTWNGHTTDFTTNNTGIVGYQRVRGRGGDLYKTIRTFFYFDTSGITGTVSAATLNMTGYWAGSADVIVVPSTAFAGDGSADMVSSEYGNISFNTNYGSEVTSWSTSGNNAITLASTALTNIKDNDYFICALIEHDQDYLDSAPTSTISVFNGVDFSSQVAYLDYTVATAGYGNRVIPVPAAHIGEINGIPTANVSKVIGVS